MIDGRAKLERVLAYCQSFSQWGPHEDWESWWEAAETCARILRDWGRA